MFDTFGNKVKIKNSAETEEKKLAGKIGEVFGQSIPSMMDFEIIGTLKEDVAINVHFEELGESFWFAEDLLEYVDNGQGTVITLDGVDEKWNKGADGEWIEEDKNTEKESLNHHFDELCKTLIAMSLPANKQRVVYGYGDTSSEMLNDFYLYYSSIKDIYNEGKISDEAIEVLNEIDVFTSNFNSVYSSIDLFWDKLGDFEEWEILREKASKAIILLNKTNYTIKVNHETSYNNYGEVTSQSSEVKLVLNHSNKDLIPEEHKRFKGKIYAISGLGADNRVFKHLSLDYDLIPIEYIENEQNESIESYSKRLLTTINSNEEFGLIGVSFGGLIVIEMMKFINPEFTFLISSAKNKDELPIIACVIGKLKILKIMPIQFFKPPRFIANLLFGAKNKSLLHQILDDTNLKFAKWASIKLVEWTNLGTKKKVIKIGGSQDIMIPISHGDKSIEIKYGKHFMIVDNAKEISRIINGQIKIRHHNNG